MYLFLCAYGNNQTIFNFTPWNYNKKVNGSIGSDTEDLINELVEGKELHLNEAKSEGKRVISEAKNKAEDLLNDVNKLIDQINQDKN